ncbi:hypothetical protein ACP70R_029744 [Stipagrostis hirtigluma subsp. patula]
MAMEQVAYYSFLFLALLLLLKIKKRGKNVAGLRLPPGPSRLPFIGSLHHFVRNPLAHRAMAELARRLGAPLMYLELGEVPVVVASSPDAAREIMKTHDVAFASRPWIPSMRPSLAAGAVGMLFSPYGALWRQLRKVCVVEVLSAKRVQSFRRIREDEVGRLVAGIAASPPGVAVDVGERVSVLTTDSTVRAMIGDRLERRDELLQSIQEGAKLVSGLCLGDLFPSSRLVRLLSGTADQVAAVHRKTSELMDCVIRQHDERRAAMPDGDAKEDDDILDVLLRIQKEGGLEVPLTTATLKTVILELFSGGSETSSNTLQWAMSELIRNPRVMRKAQAEVRDKLQGKPTVTEDDLADLKYMRLIIKETLRMHPVIPLLIPRECRESCKIMGYDIPKGAMVFVNAWAISRDPKYWDDAEVFKPERFEDSTIDFKGTDFEFTPFGAGRRMCPGMTFAQANMELVLAALLYHFDWELPNGRPPSELDMTEEMGVTVGRKSHLYLNPIVRVPPHVAP